MAAKTTAFKSLHMALEEIGEDRKWYRLAKARDRRACDLNQVKCIKGEDGAVLVKDVLTWERNIKVEKVKEVICRMRQGRATRPNEIPVNFWKSISENNKEDIESCTKYKGIKLLSHTMKVWERVVELRMRNTMTISKNQFGFMLGHSTTKAIHLVRRLVKQFWERKKDLSMVFINLEKVYVRVPRKILWRCLKASRVPVAYTRSIQDMYNSEKTM
ncbi:uncharacterized protein LOC107868846 [Capsicum annuum]|uniref:uncharacterized protein LOC107868846 n=1 Tax=Capsicum annuum TaxID=4072 RepID=UPI0007BEFB9A|nr:uncharacterized protein LOC107868846 [Capsicum annuum]